MQKCGFCKTEFQNEFEKYCCYWCELHGEILKRILMRMERKKEILEKDNHAAALGLTEAILIVESEFEKVK